MNRRKFLNFCARITPIIMLSACSLQKIPVGHFDSVIDSIEPTREDFTRILADQKVRGLLKGGVRLGVSSRGLGSVKEVDGVNEVQNDFTLKTVDIVSKPI